MRELSAAWLASRRTGVGPALPQYLKGFNGAPAVGVNCRDAERLRYRPGDAFEEVTSDLLIEASESGRNRADGLDKRIADGTGGAQVQHHHDRTDR